MQKRYLPTSKKALNIALFIISSLAIAGSIVVTGKIIFNNYYRQAGIVVLTWDGPSIDEVIQLIPQRRSILSKIPSKVSLGIPSSLASIVNNIETNLPDVNDILKDVATDIVSKIPQSCSVGIQEICISSPAHVYCHSFPIRITEMLPKEILELSHYMPKQRNYLDTIDKILHASSPTTIFAVLISSTVLIFLLALGVTLFVLNHSKEKHDPVGIKTTRWAMAIIFVIGLLCSALNGVAIGVTIHIVKMALKLPRGIRVGSGDINIMFFINLICSVVVFSLSLVIVKSRTTTNMSSAESLERQNKWHCQTAKQSMGIVKDTRYHPQRGIDKRTFGM